MKVNQQDLYLYHRCVTILFVLTLLLTNGCAGINASGTAATNETGSHTDAKNILKGKNSEELLRGGYTHLASGNNDLAKMLFLRVIEQTPESHRAFIGLGEVEYKEGNYEKAYMHFDRAYTLDSNNINAQMGKARSMRQQNKLNAAIKEINAAIAVAPNDVAVLTELAIIYDLMGKEALSGPIYKEILDRTPDQAGSNNNLGLNFLTQGKYEQAIIAFERAIAIDSNDDRIKNNMGTAFALYGNEQMALNIFKDTVGEAGAYNNLGYLYMNQGQLEEAKRSLEKALELSPVYYQKAQENLDLVNQRLKSHN